MPCLIWMCSQGKGEKEALENIKEAITAWLWAEDQKVVSKLKISSESKPILISV